ncbi:pantoate--beta-alanine ligase [Mesobacterium sp. TK19101]|uniref:Pantothenate synthetase n=1 Tax=Mesobacterium hydrothermale TaxID=3111907 RepID=A0ABU6HFK7_9RHOB|nr:pantoate--beta-alanine ligase [Mesobacterium sp. TK19101]MEC3860907.1 pantoate--beta-alanine ligase [Mesobacterium sp. TK19101]
MTPPILRRLSDLRALTTRWRRAGDTIGVVPTMGALHDGHLSLVSAAKADCDRVIVTIFVNPKQFNNPEDLAKYPRTEARDAEKLAPRQIDAIWCPDPDQMYPDGFTTNVSVSGLTNVLCGAHRPGHFDGVATVVAKLFLQTSADRAYFGEKDFQQLQVVRRMTADLNIPTEVIGCPTVRETDGLAMSSRNLRLDPQARVAASALNRAMGTLADGLAAGLAWDGLCETALHDLDKAGFEEVEYLDLRAIDDLSLLHSPDRDARLFAAAWIGGIRLIDNIPVAGQGIEDSAQSRCA